MIFFYFSLFSSEYGFAEEEERLETEDICEGVCAEHVMKAILNLK
jgi:hypothetical protein